MYKVCDGVSGRDFSPTIYFQPNSFFSHEIPATAKCELQLWAKNLTSL